MVVGRHDSSKHVKTATGIAGLDEITSGGLPAGCTTLVVGSPGCGKAVFGLDLLQHDAVQGHYQVEVIDVADPKRVAPGDVLAAPLIVRRAPLPELRLVGDLSQVDKAAEALGLSQVGLHGV